MVIVIYIMVKLRFDLRSCGFAFTQVTIYWERKKHLHNHRQGIDKLLYQMNIKENTMEWFSHEDDYFLM